MLAPGGAEIIDDAFLAVNGISQETPVVVCGDSSYQQISIDHSDARSLRRSEQFDPESVTVSSPARKSVVEALKKLGCEMVGDSMLVLHDVFATDEIVTLY